MSGLLRRIRLRRAADGDPVNGASATPAPAPGDPAAADGVPANAFPWPAGTDPEEIVGAPLDTQRRGRLRKRLRHLRRVREILLRDLGGFVYEIHRYAGGDREAHAPVLSAKLTRLANLDSEARDLEERLEDRTGALMLREPGIGGTCPTCGELFGSEARFCSNCGMPLVAGAARPVPALGAGPSLDAPVATAVPTASTEPVAVADVATTEMASIDSTVEPDPPEAEVVPEPAAPAPDAPTAPRDWLPAGGLAGAPERDDDAAPTVSSGDPLAPRREPEP